MKKHNYISKQDLQLIADILGCHYTPENLKHQLSNNAINWDTIVATTSRHLVLPALFCRLQQKSLLPDLPEDLVSYLEELTHLNRHRNETLYKELVEISNVFHKHKIRYTFMKGAAMLAGNYYTDPGERMIGDIDILVESEHLDKAFHLLVDEGYSKFVEFNYKVKNYRHLPRQISESRLGAIELHDQILKHGHNHLIDKVSFLDHSIVYNGMCIPEADDLIWNIILAQQINDKASYFGAINFKGIYDVLALKLHSRPELMTKLSQQTDALKFLSISSIFFPALAPAKTKASDDYKANFMFTLNNRTLSQYLRKTKVLATTIGNRIALFIFNKSYRLHLLNIKRVK